MRITYKSQKLDQQIGPPLAEGYFTYINGSDHYDSYSVSALKKLIEELIQSKGGSLQ